MALPIYELEGEYQELANLPLESETVDGEETDALDRRLAAIEDDQATKLLSLAKVVRTLEAEAEMLEAHARALTARAAARRRRVHFLKRWLHLQLEADGVSKLKDAFVTVWLQKSPPSIEVRDEAVVPPAYRRVTLRLPLSCLPPELWGYVQGTDVDRQAIHELIRATGEVPPGVGYRNDERHLRIA